MKNIESLGMVSAFNPKKFINLCLKGVENKCMSLIKEI